MKFELVKFEELPKASEFLEKTHPDSTIIAGGTDLLISIQDGEIKPKYLVDIYSIRESSMDQIVLREDGLYIGSRVTIEQLQEYLESLKGPLGVMSALHDAADNFANEAIKNIATIGGNIGTAVSAADFIVVLKSLNASAIIAGQNYVRKEPVDKIVVEKRQLSLKPGELILGFTIPVCRRCGSAFMKFNYRATNILALVSFSILLKLSDDNKIESAKVVFDRVKRRIPDNVPEVEQYLAGKYASTETLEDAVSVLMKNMIRKGDFRASGEYREHLSKVLFKRAFWKAYQRARVV